jgi:hypothetical protein
MKIIENKIEEAFVSMPLTRNADVEIVSTVRF